jgi:hypothetical protein
MEGIQCDMLLYLEIYASSFSNAMLQSCKGGKCCGGVVLTHFTHSAFDIQ